MTDEKAFLNLYGTYVNTVKDIENGVKAVTLTSSISAEEDEKKLADSLRTLKYVFMEDKDPDGDFSMTDPEGLAMLLAACNTNPILNTSQLEGGARFSEVNSGIRCASWMSRTSNKCKTPKTKTSQGEGWIEEAPHLCTGSCGEKICGPLCSYSRIDGSMMCWECSRPEKLVIDTNRHETPSFPAIGIDASTQMYDSSFHFT